MKKAMYIFILGVFLTSCVSDPAKPRATDEAMATLYKSCLVCHSTQEAARGPYIDGMDAWYTLAQLKKFKDGIRGQNRENRSEHLMGSNQGARVDEKMMKPLARYIEALPVRKHLKIVKGDAERGREVYKQCAACHGDKAQGRKLLKGPALRNLEDWYQLDQLRKFKKEWRGYHDKDTQGRIMSASVKAMSDKDLKDVTVYIVETFAEKLAD